MKIKIACLSLFLTISNAVSAQAECAKWERLSQSAQKSFQAGDYERAEQIWLKAADEAAMCGEREPSFPISFKRLGECYQKDGKFVDADLAYQKAADAFKRIGTDDSELTADVAALNKVYRVVQFCELNKGVADAFKESGVNLIGLCKLDQGNRIQMNLNDKFTRTLDNADVDQMALDKLVSFDVIEQPDGTLSIKNIKGLKVHAKMWVTIVESQLHPRDPKGASAEVTATKMGVTKTVSCKLPSDSIDPMNTLLGKLRDFNNGIVASINNPNPTLTPMDSSASNKSPSQNLRPSEPTAIPTTAAESMSGQTIQTTQTEPSVIENPESSEGTK